MLYLRAASGGDTAYLPPMRRRGSRRFPACGAPSSCASSSFSSTRRGPR
jgi:hypothetical protein